MQGRTRFILFAVLAVGIMAFFLSRADLRSVGDAIVSADWALLSAAFAAMVVNLAVRATRWRYFLRPVGRVGFVPAIRSTLMGLAATALLPGRVGELVRPCTLARSEGLSTGSVLATTVMERLFDLVAMLLIFAGSNLFLAQDVAIEPSVLRAVRLGAALAGGVAVLILGLARLAAGHRQSIGPMVERFGSWLPQRVVRLASRVLERFAFGFSVMRERGALSVALGWSVVIWLLISAWLWLTAAAFDIHLSPAGAATLLVVTAIGVAVPTPAGVGGFHAGFVGATALYGATTDVALAAALVAHAMAFVPQTLAGIALMMREGTRLGSVSRLNLELPDEASKPRSRS